MTAAAVALVAARLACVVVQPAVHEAEREWAGPLFMRPGLAMSTIALDLACSATGLPLTWISGLGSGSTLAGDIIALHLGQSPAFRRYIGGGHR